jgi:aspartate ammonia-lyase
MPLKTTRAAAALFPPVHPTLGDVPVFVRSYGLVKAAAARANGTAGVLDPAVARAVEEAALGLYLAEASELLALPIIQGGGGTATNLAVNEAVAAQATVLLGSAVHPIDHVNRSQSTNDTYPTAMALTLLELCAGADAQLDRLVAALVRQGDRHQGLQRLGRTCLQDALPVEVAQTHRAQANGIERCRLELARVAEELLHVPLGGTAVGTGFGAPEGWGATAVAELAALSGRPLQPSADRLDAFQHLDGYAAVAAAVTRVALVLGKIAADLRLLSSGPVAGFGELRLPALLPGSSIMPGKVNPVVPELVIQYCFRIRGAAHTVELAVGAGELELNVWEPVIVAELTTALTLLTEAARVLSDKCVDGLEWDSARLAQHLEGSFGPRIEVALQSGYDLAAALERP